VSAAGISYGKLGVPVQRVGVAPLHGLPAIPESSLRSLDSGLLACEVSVEVLGEGFLAAYTEGDNRRLVATETMKNVILRRALEYDGATLEGLLDVLGRVFLGTHAVMGGLRLTAREVPFAPAGVGAGGAPSDRLFRLGDGDHAVAQTVFHEFVSESIQHLVHEIGGRVLQRFAVLDEVELRAENHTFDPVPGSPESGDGPRAYTAPFHAWGLITLTMRR
jgi:urate oxidase